MYRYYVNTRAQANGDHEVHREGCSYMPDPSNREDLGIYPSCHGAVEEARRRGYNANGGKFCSPACHTG